jgi:hypothetical protein
MRAYVMAIALVMAGCAGRPAMAPKPTGSSVQPAPPVLAPSEGETRAQRQAQAKAMGYTLVNQDGEDMYCRTSVQTGSRLKKETVCLTASDMGILREATRQTFSSPTLQMPPRQGR